MASKKKVGRNKVVTEEVADRRKKLFDIYVKPYYKMIYKLCMNYTNSRYDVEENYNEVLTNLYKYIETYNPERPIRTWLHIVTKRCVFDIDKKRKSNLDMWSDDENVENYLPSDQLAEEDRVCSKAVTIDNYRSLYSDEMLNALDQLKPQYRRPLILQQAGYKLKEIAAIEHQNGNLESSNIETIKSRLFLARQTLQTLITRDGKIRNQATAN